MNTYRLTIEPVNGPFRGVSYMEHSFVTVPVGKIITVENGRQLKVIACETVK